jgi:crossover junction endodeoxyribonuclease RuvC
VIVVGIDPGLANLGIGVVREVGKTPHFVHSELVRTSSELETAQRLAMIYRAVKGVLEVHAPEALAIESQYFHERQAANAFKVGQAAGVVLLACAQHGVPVFEYGPMQVKQALVGTGGASKEQVIFMVRATLALPKNPESTHAADALGLALTHLASRRVREAGQMLRRA